MEADGLQVEGGRHIEGVAPEAASTHEATGTIDDILTYTLLCIGVSAEDFKSDSEKWWSKAKRLALALRLDRQDATMTCDEPPQSLAETEMQEERRRVFWLLYALDRHLALSFNRVLEIPDLICDVYGTAL